jgi:hypothetical protein
MQAEVTDRLQDTFDFIEECAFDTKSRAWKKADLFTLLIELDQCLHIRSVTLQPSKVLETLTTFYASIDNSAVTQDSVSSIYYKAALQASNDKINRIRRGVVIGSLLLDLTYEEILEKMKIEGLA